ncbi:hypothetical protein HWV00_18450 [Moritella sp. 24]|uniref:hypothetical protein n=1 Tax=Moritella sp. 24 TaxID=2746230 RepID=UPI001BA61630|nr:hypothetical protein [Moritella sp. 24]QUM78034.1 hypothetical protein HWV00_18450 [Moritella sp. 24]
MSRLLALSILVSTALTGCGGSGSSDAGPTPPSPAKKYTFEFVKLTQDSKSECTVFDGLGQNFDTKYFAYNVQPQRIEIHDGNGSYSKELSSENGSITFTVDDVPDGGYVSIIDYRAGSPNYQVLSIQKQLLGDYLIRLNGDSLNTCYSKGKALETKSGFASILVSGLPVNYFQFETGFVTTERKANNSVNISAYADEKVLAKGYEGDTTNLIAYAFVSELTANANDDLTLINGFNDSLNWSTDFDLNDLDSLQISIKQGSYTYPWFDAQFDPATDTKTAFPYTYEESEWLYTAMGTTLNWDFKHNSAFSDTLDASLMVNIDSDVAPSISKNGASYVFSAPGISSTDDLVQRSYYYTETSGPNSTLTHVIYSVPNEDGEVVIPDLKLDRLLPITATSDAIKVSMIATKSRNTDFVESFMRRFQPLDPNIASFPMNEDSISLLLTPAEQLEQRQYTKMHDYTIVER